MEAKRRGDGWLSTSACARSIGVSDWWVRERIEEGLLRATVIAVGRRRIYKVRESDWLEFRARHTGDALDPRFERS